MIMFKDGKSNTSPMQSDKLTRITILAVGLTVIDALRKYAGGTGITVYETCFAIAGNVLLAYFLSWLQDRWKLQRRGTALLLWANLFIVGSLSNMIEGYYFTNVFESPNQFIVGGLFMLAFSGLEAGFASYMLPVGDNNLAERLKAYLGNRTKGNLAKSVVLGTVSYFPVYFFFGMLVSPFVMPYYSDPSMGLIIPPFSTIIPLEILRGFMYVAVLLPIAACLDANSWNTAVALIGMLFIPGALLPLLADQGLPVQIIPYHLVEIFADSVVYGFILARLLSSKKKA